ncbi:hypothetical protein L6452_17037 [Arctium lappa]|uniref:Uncharacterized protein n=1 Tax=Arctium lappa TaxID=4217 RepID=A0ACB9C257_ARCLA|nr:hypothetical protein L6452_17037 [Arctium lappa]
MQCTNTSFNSKCMLHIYKLNSLYCPHQGLKSQFLSSSHKRREGAKLNLPVYTNPIESFLLSWTWRTSIRFLDLNPIHTQMGCQALFAPVILTEPCPTSPNFTSFSLPSLSPNLHNSSSRIVTRLRDFDFGRRGHHQLNCSYNQNSSSSSSMENAQDPPQEAVLKAISEVSKAEGRVGQTTNMVLGGTITGDSTTEWLGLNEMLNIYPAPRGFTAIGSGGDDFVQAMVIAVESVIQHRIPQGQVKQKFSSGGKYVSVNIGPVQIASSKQVQAVYHAMRRDVRMRYFL